LSKPEQHQHKLLAHWAAGCAEHVLPVFEELNPEDARPRKAIDAVRAWICDEMKVSEVRKFAFAAHAAAREAGSPQSIAAARAAGHAAATAHVASHAKHAASYALKAAGDPIAEKQWQLLTFPESGELSNAMES
jgi:hypothetical protein